VHSSSPLLNLKRAQSANTYSRGQTRNLANQGFVSGPLLEDKATFQDRYMTIAETEDDMIGKVHETSAPTLIKLNSEQPDIVYGQAGSTLSPNLGGPRMH
jgi:hypothetical protein